MVTPTYTVRQCNSQGEKTNKQKWKNIIFIQMSNLSKNLHFGALYDMHCSGNVFAVFVYLLLFVYAMG